MEKIMSTNTHSSSVSVVDIIERKGGEPIVSLTAYTTPIARIVDSHCDFVLVGDSVGMVHHGLNSTLGVTMEMMIMHGKAVRRGLKHAMLVVDMPFGSYEESKEQAFRNAATIMRETSCEAIKLEGGIHMAETIEYLTNRGIPVMAHVGLTPQSVNVFGGYNVQGRGEDSKRVLRDAVSVFESGAFSVVLEMVTESIADQITQTVGIPTIGIGASAACDGQILVVDDLLGMFTDFTPKFVRQYAHMGLDADKAIKEYAMDVKNRNFPAPEHVFGNKKPSSNKDQK